MKKTIPVDSKNTLMVAHRGLSGLEPENTAIAFTAAANRSYYGIETDVHVTSDGKFVCIHDDNAKRTSGADMSVEGSDFSSLMSLTLYDTNGTKSRHDAVIPTLDDYIRICRDYGKRAVLELKNPMEKEHIESIISAIKALDYLDGTIFISFAMQNLVYAREIDSSCEVQFLTGKYTEELIEKLSGMSFDLDIYFEQITSKQQVEYIHSKGVKINVWTVDSKEKCEELADFGVDFITSNICE